MGNKGVVAVVCEWNTINSMCIPSYLCALANKAWGRMEIWYVGNLYLETCVRFPVKYALKVTISVNKSEAVGGKYTVRY